MRHTTIRFFVICFITRSIIIFSFHIWFLFWVINISVTVIFHSEASFWSTCGYFRMRDDTLTEWSWIKILFKSRKRSEKSIIISSSWYLQSFLPILLPMTVVLRVTLTSLMGSWKNTKVTMDRNYMGKYINTRT